MAALSVGWMVGFGGTYTAPLTALAAGFEVLGVVVTRVRMRDPAARLGRIVAMGLLVAALTVGVSLLRLWPVAETLTDSPRLLGGKPGTAPVAVWKYLFGDASNHWAKADFLIGLPVLPLVVFGVWRKRAIAPAIGAALWIWFSLGYKVHASLFAVLRTIPPYTMLRAPERFLLFVALAAATIAALGVRRLEVAMRKTRGFVVVALAFHALLLADTAILVHLGQARADARKLDPEPPMVDREFRQTRGNRWLAAYYPLMSRGSLTCFDDYNIAQSPQLRGDLPEEEYLKDKGAGTVKRVRWSPDHVDLQVDLTRPARVYVNQNWHPGWRSNVGEVVSEDGLLSVDLPAGAHALELRFWPRSAVVGIATSLLAIFVACWIIWRARAGADGASRDTVRGTRDWLTTTALALAPFLVTALGLLLMREPRRPPPPLITPTGEAMVVAAPPEDTTPLNARWDDGMVLVASHVELEPADEAHGPLAVVELDWRFDQPVPPGLGVYIQFERPGGHFATDHILLSGVLVPEAAPLHAILRDVSDVNAVPETKKETTWTVYAGLWRARRDMERLPVIDRGQATISANRVLVGTFTVTP